MAKIKWPTIEDKLEAIGYLAVPGVISDIEANVPYGKKNDFIEKYKGRFSEEYPYEYSKDADKYGQQFRIYLNDTDGCPKVLKRYLDKKYGNRINNSLFVEELVTDYGFRFTKEPQDSENICEIVRWKHKSAQEIQAFKRGYHIYKELVQNIEDAVSKEYNLSNPNILKYKRKEIKRSSTYKQNKEQKQTGFTPNQMLKLGWSGEEYIAYLLKTKDESFIKALSIPANTDYTVEWFNDGVQRAEEKLEINPYKKFSYEIRKKWDDKSIGKGCDIVVTLESGKSIYIEVKTSMRSYSYFSMTSSEIQEMELRANNYYLIKVNNFIRLLDYESPDVIVVRNPYKKLFHPNQIKEATFIIGGK